MIRFRGAPARRKAQMLPERIKKKRLSRFF